MNRNLVAGLGVVVIAAGVLTIVTAARMSQRGNVPQGGHGGSSKDDFVHGDAWKKDKVAKYFQLTERSGRAFDSRDLDGEVWVASFFFVSCPTACRQQNENIARMHRQWGPKGVTFVSITCDPKNDGPKELRDYANKFDADPKSWQFLTGEFDDIRKIGSEIFGVGVLEGGHRNLLSLVDRWGNVRGTFDWQEEGQLAKLDETIGVLLEETEPPPEKPKEKPKRKKFIDLDEDGNNDLDDPDFKPTETDDDK